jgi:hypothetical protein
MAVGRSETSGELAGRLLEVLKGGVEVLVAAVHPRLCPVEVAARFGPAGRPYRAGLILAPPTTTPVLPLILEPGRPEHIDRWLVGRHLSGRAVPPASGQLRIAAVAST